MLMESSILITPPFVPEGTGCQDRQEGENVAQLTRLRAEQNDLRAELEQLRSERSRWAEMQSRIMQLLGSTNPDKLVHDLRNVLNERDLLKALVDEI